MTRINLSEFREYSASDLYSFLLILEDTELEITVPRYFKWEPELHSSPVIDEYFSLAYAGNLMAQISDSFSYHVPDAATDKPFRFELQSEQLLELSEIFVVVINACITFEDDRFFDFKEAAAKFFGDAFDERVECSTWGLLYVANRLLGEQY